MSEGSSGIETALKLNETLISTVNYVVGYFVDFTSNTALMMEVKVSASFVAIVLPSAPTSSCNPQCV